MTRLIASLHTKWQSLHPRFTVLQGPIYPYYYQQCDQIVDFEVDQFLTKVAQKVDTAAVT